MHNWSYGARFAFVCMSMLLTVLVIIPGLILAIGRVLGLSRCDEVSTEGFYTYSTICTPTGRFVSIGLMVFIFVPLVLRWGRFLRAVLKWRN